MIIPFRFQFFRDRIVCVCYGITHGQKLRLGSKKRAWFCSVQCHKQNETIHKKKWQIGGRLFIWILALSRDARSDAPVIWWRRNLAIAFFLIFFIFQHFLYMCECVLCWMCLYLHDYHLFECKSARYYCVITAIDVNSIYMNRVWFIDFMAHLYDYHLYNWPSAHQHVIIDYMTRIHCKCCISSNLRMFCNWHTKVKSFLLFLFFLLKLFLLYFSSGQINHLFDV